MKPTRLVFAFVPVACILVSLSSNSFSHSDTPRAGQQAAMQQLFRELADLFRLILDPGEFENPANRDVILTSLSSLSGNAEQLVAHGQTDDPSSDYFSRSLNRDADQAVMRFRQDQYEGARFLVEELVNNCFACHSRLPVDEVFLPGEQFLDETGLGSLSAEELARVQVTMRQFDTALSTYETLFASQDVPAGKIAASASFADYLRICLRVKCDCDRAMDTFDRFRRRPDVPPCLDDRLDRWVEDLEDLKKDNEKAERDLLGSGRQLIRDGQYENDFPNDPQGTVRFVAATGYLHRYLQSRPDEQRWKVEAYYLLGVAESYIAPSCWRSQTDALLERAIRTSPRSVFGLMALNFLEEYTTSGYTGSSGVNVPPEVQEHLDELRALVEGGE